MFNAEHDPDALDALPPGAPIGGYTVRRTLGHGGFGITYEAHNKITGKEVAIKEFFPSSMARRDGNSRLIFSRVNAETISWALRKFEETTTTLSGLSHPNIVQVLDYVPANETGYMIMELVDGQTLEHWLRARSAPPGLDELHPILDPVMAALIYVHGRGLIHRDIAPDNILITREGRPVLIDFGSVSRDLSDAKRQAMSSTVGLTKRHYTAPEQMLSKARPTPEADVYSMGAVLYRALSGDKPVDGQERIDAAFRSQPDPYQPLMGRRGSGCPARAAEAVDRAMAVRPEGRLHKIADLRAAMVPPAAAAPAPQITRGLVAAVAAMVVLAALAGGLVGAWIARPDDRQADGDLARQRQEIDAAQATLDATGKEIERQRNELNAAKAELARQRGEVRPSDASGAPTTSSIDVPQGATSLKCNNFTIPDYDSAATTAKGVADSINAQVTIENDTFYVRRAKRPVIVLNYDSLQIYGDRDFLQREASSIKEKYFPGLQCAP